jgi:hypothetical protein
MAMPMYRGEVGDATQSKARADNIAIWHALCCPILDRYTRSIDSHWFHEGVNAKHLLRLEVVPFLANATSKIFMLIFEIHQLLFDVPAVGLGLHMPWLLRQLFRSGRYAGSNICLGGLAAV